MSIFVSYRRGVTEDIVGRICDRLRASVGTVFHDLASLGGGDHFGPKTIQALQSAKVVLVVIGPDWLRDGAIHNPDDWVRREVETVLERRDVRVIPVLVLGAKLPRRDELPESLHGLLERQAVSVSSGQDFGVHIARLEKAIRPFVTRLRRIVLALSAVFGAALVTAGAYALWTKYVDNVEPPPPPVGGDDTVSLTTVADSGTNDETVAKRDAEQKDAGKDVVAPTPPPPDPPPPKPIQIAARECESGEFEEQSCGDCGTKKRTCRRGKWNPYGTCVGNTTRTNSESCGNCGTKTQACTAEGHWGPFGACGEGECAPGATRSTACGNCGKRVDTCSAQCQWVEGTCSAQGACAQNATRTVSCGRCGERVDRCSAQCQWETGSCRGEGVCSAGQRQSCGNSHATCRQGSRTCNNQCQWGSCQGMRCDPFPVPTDRSDFHCGPNMFNTSVCNKVIATNCPVGSVPTGTCSNVVNFGGRGTCRLVGVAVSGRVAKATVRATVGATQGTGCRIDTCDCRYSAM